MSQAVSRKSGQTMIVPCQSNVKLLKWKINVAGAEGLDIRDRVPIVVY